MSDSQFMLHAIELARQGEGRVEPNPMVGCVLARDGQVVGAGWHQAFGGPHAEIHALAEAGSAARGATAYVTLEPCCHHGKTPPCTQALIAAEVRKVVVALADPFPQVAGRGIAVLQAAGIEVEVGLEEAAARSLAAPFLKLVTTGQPWVICKWAMTLDGKIATATGQSRWISGEASRQVVHQLRGRVDAIIVGRGTAEVDDPALTVRLADRQNARVPVRIVLDPLALLKSTSQLVSTARETPTLIAASDKSSPNDRSRLQAAGCEVFVCPGATYQERWQALVTELGRRRMTNVLVEGGSQVFGGLLDAGQVDEFHAFIAPILLGGADAPGPFAGAGATSLAVAARLVDMQVQKLGDDCYVRGRVARPADR